MYTTIQETVETILNKLQSPFKKIKIEEQDNTYKINIESEEPSLLIGHHGENIHALQTLIKAILKRKNSNSEDEFKIVLDIDNYRKRQEENLIELAERKAELVIQTNRQQSLPPMSGYFRRLIHLHIAEKYDNIATESEGENEYRHLILKPTN